MKRFDSGKSPAQTRREFLRMGLGGIGFAGAMPLFFQSASNAFAQAALQSNDENMANRILVVVELSGGNDGLNTVVPHANDDYYKLRPTLGIPKNKTLRIDDNYGFHTNMTGVKELYDKGMVAVVHGCGYPQPSFSHFTSMSYWHTGAPNSGETTGWVGRLADGKFPEPTPNLLVNIGRTQSLAVRSRLHAPLVFSDPDRLLREANRDQAALLENMPIEDGGDNASLAYLNGIAKNAKSSSVLVREAWAKYRTPIDYGVGLGDLRKVAALIEAGLPTRLFYVTYSGNSFDTHVHQADPHGRLLMYTSDALVAFWKDLERIGKADRVVMMVFTEFGRRPLENTSQGTDHGAPGPMFVIGPKVKGGLYGEHPSLADLDEGNMKMTTDFRRVYATMSEKWMLYPDTEKLLKKKYETFGLIA